MAKGYGDRLARGGSKAVFPSSEGGISDRKWADAFGDFDAEKYRGDADVQEADTSSKPGKTKRGSR